MSNTTSTTEETFNPTSIAENRIIGLDKLLDDVMRILRNIKLGEIENLPDRDNGSLQTKLEFYGELAEIDPVYEERVANILV